LDKVKIGMVGDLLNGRTVRRCAAQGSDLWSGFGVGLRLSRFRALVS